MVCNGISILIITILYLLHNSSKYKRDENKNPNRFICTFKLFISTLRHWRIFHDYEVIKQFSLLLLYISYLDACFFVLWNVSDINSNKTMTQTRQKRDSFKILFFLFILLIKCKILKSFSCFMPNDDDGLWHKYMTLCDFLRGSNWKSLESFSL